VGDQKIILADRVFTGETWLTDHAVVINNDRITAVTPSASIAGDAAVSKYPGCFIAPAFIDLQIYGAYGKLLAVYPEAESLSLLNDYCRKGGAAFCLPTAATNTYDVFYKCIDAVKDYWQKGGNGILGLHIEGPWINKIKRGAHIESLIHSPTLEQTKELLDYGEGVIKMITLAPEVCSQEVIDLILSRGIVVAAGHSNASYKEAIKGFTNGIKTATHLYNAMSPLQHREPGLAGAAMDHENTTASIIPDGYHVDYAAIRIAKQVMKERLFVITDAVTETDTGYYPHKLAGDKYESEGILSGSALTMSKAVKNLVEHCQIGLSEALRMASLYPARVMSLEHEFGRIEEGHKAAVVVLNEKIEVMELLS
jgi:N-acetylglucosamine-6-phosphate deacetylase